MDRWYNVHAKIYTCICIDNSDHSQTHCVWASTWTCDIRTYVHVQPNVFIEVVCSNTCIILCMANWWPITVVYLLYVFACYLNSYGIKSSLYSYIVKHKKYWLTYFGSPPLQLQHKPQPPPPSLLQSFFEVLAISYLTVGECCGRTTASSCYVPSHSQPHEVSGRWDEVTDHTMHAAARAQALCLWNHELQAHIGARQGKG